MPNTSQTGITGTVAYMSPEQALGYKVDQRCDIWALGVVLVEMLSGGNPFRSDSTHSILVAILNDAAKHRLPACPPASRFFIGLQQRCQQPL